MYKFLMKHSIKVSAKQTYREIK